METNNTIQLPANMTIGKVEEGKIFLKPAFEDGDVLVSGNSGEPFVYNGKYNIEEDSIGCYIGIGSSRELNIDSLSVPTSHWSSFCKARKATEQEKGLPKTWEDFCRMYSGAEEEEYYIGIAVLGEEKAKAMAAFIQLIHLRDCYRNGWKPTFYPTVQFLSTSNLIIEFFLSNLKK